jgi:hypothetical protein
MREYEQSGGSTGALVLGWFALLFSLAALGGVGYMMFLRPDPLGKGLAKYDFSTPAAAMKSELEMEANFDVRAGLELQRKTKKKPVEEMINSLSVKKEEEWRGKKILFVSFTRDGVEKHETQAFEKQADTGFWVKSPLSSFDVREDNKKLADMMESWTKSGTFKKTSDE